MPVISAATVAACSATTEPEALSTEPEAEAVSAMTVRTFTGAGRRNHQAPAKQPMKRATTMPPAIQGPAFERTRGSTLSRSIFNAWSASRGSNSVSTSSLVCTGVQTYCPHGEQRVTSRAGDGTNRCGFGTGVSCESAQAECRAGLLPIGAAENELGPVGENHRLVAVEQRLNLPHGRDAHHRRTVDAHELPGVQARFEPTHGFANELGFLAGVQAEVVSRGFDPVDCACVHEDSAAHRAHRDAVEIGWGAFGPRDRPTAPVEKFARFL